MIVRLSETSRERRWGHEQKRWAWINDRESGLSHSAGGIFASPDSYPHSPASQLLPPPRSPGGHRLGGESHQDGMSSCLSVPNLSHFSSCPSPLPCHVFLQVPPPFSPSLLRRAPWRNHLHPPSLPPLLCPDTSQSGLSCFTCSCSLVTKLISLLWGVNLIHNHVIQLPARKLWKLSITPSFMSSPLAFVTTLFLKKFLFYTGVQLIYNVVLASGVQQSDPVIHIHISILFQILFPYRLLQNIE